MEAGKIFVIFLLTGSKRGKKIKKERFESMKIKVSDYIADFLVDHGITQVFTVTGGGAMHLNDALGRLAGLHPHDGFVRPGPV